MRFNSLVVGCGGREHSIVKALSKSQLRPKLYCYGTYRNPGILALVEAYASANSYEVSKIVDFAKRHSVDFAFIGGEEPLGNQNV